MARINENTIACVIAAAVAGSCLISLFGADAPQFASKPEHIAVILTLPASLLGILIRARDGDSIGFWLVGVAVWVATTFLQFRLLAAAPRYFSSRARLRTAIQLFLAGVVVLAIIWLARTWPDKQQEEPTLFFIQAPLWLLTATVIVFAIVWSSRWHDRT